jgi:hypothetical protein
LEVSLSLPHPPHSLSITLSYLPVLNNSPSSLLICLSPVPTSVLSLLLQNPPSSHNSGFFKPPAILPAYYSWIDALSYVKYGYIGGSLLELTGLEYSCTLNGTLVSNTTCVETGEEVIDVNGFDYISAGGCIGVLIGYIVAMRILGWLGMRFITW